MHEAESAHPSPRAEHPPATETSIPQWTSQQILGQAHEAHIQHGHETYRLLLTRNQKLILIK
jgi:hemin uptake protein HemP